MLLIAQVFIRDEIFDFPPLLFQSIWMNKRAISFCLWVESVGLIPRLLLAFFVASLYFAYPGLDSNKEK